MRLGIRYFKQRRKLLIFWLLACLIFSISFLLYHLPVAAVIYPGILTLLAGMSMVAVDFRAFVVRHRRLTEMRRLAADVMTDFPEPSTVEDEDYQQLIARLREEQRQLENHMTLRYQDMMDYYTVWVHQIKTPIAAMRLTLQNEDTELSRRIQSDLFRIEQYVEMVLCYLRLDGDSTDYVIGEYELDSIVRQAVKRFAGQFISKKLSLNYVPLKTRVVTDEKWLLFVLEQILSNALKYTEQGGISIEMEANKVLCIRDTGIGISAEDLPRIFEKGYTGYNGRSDKKASGLGLYLCRRICINLGHGLSAESEPDQGTVIRLHLAQRENRVE